MLCLLPASLTQGRWCGRGLGTDILNLPAFAAFLDWAFMFLGFLVLKLSMSCGVVLVVAVDDTGSGAEGS